MFQNGRNIFENMWGKNFTEFAEKEIFRTHIAGQKKMPATNKRKC